MACILYKFYFVAFLMIQIRLESKGGKNSSVVLCTTGVLLRVLVSRGSSTMRNGTMKDDISGITHIIMVSFFIFCLEHMLMGLMLSLVIY